MSLLNTSSPHIISPGNTGRFMRKVIYATIPGLVALTFFFGWGSLINSLIACTTAVVCETIILSIRRRPIIFFLNDYSAILTGLLLGLALPPLAPWWLTVVGSSFAIIVAKHLYGGLGNNPFNPAMIAYVLLLISFPVEMTRWLPALNSLSLTDSFSLTFAIDSRQHIDALTGATPLDEFKTLISIGQDKSTIFNSTTFSGMLVSAGWEWVNIGFLIGGIYLIFQRVITWHIPLSFLAGIVIPATVFYLIDASIYASPLFHLLSGGTMLGAFFIATDPVTAATSNTGRLYYGFLIGLLIYIIRTFGGYPDAVAFAVLLLNLAAPTIDHYTKPRTYGHNK